MGTRADFYIWNEEKEQPIWLGSYPWDGYDVATQDNGDISPNDKKDNKPNYLRWLLKTTEKKEDFVDLLKQYFETQSGVTVPENGWPWPWDNSKLTDEVYLFKDGRLWRKFDHDGNYEDHTTPITFAYPVNWEYDMEKDEYNGIEEKIDIYVPDMSDKKNVTMGERSGLIVIGGQV